MPSPRPGAFAGHPQIEAALQAAVADAVGDAARVMDLFAGCGTLSLPLLPGLSHLTAAESDNAALAALKAGVDASGRGSLTCLRADLMNAPLTPDQLRGMTPRLSTRHVPVSRRNAAALSKAAFR